MKLFSSILSLFLRGVFAEGIDAGSDRGLTRIASRVGLGAADIRAALADDGWRAIAETNRIEMLAQGLWGVPSFRVEGFEAVWGQDRLWMIEDDLVATMRATGGMVATFSSAQNIDRLVTTYGFRRDRQRTRQSMRLNCCAMARPVAC